VVTVSGVTYLQICMYNCAVRFLNGPVFESGPILEFYCPKSLSQSDRLGLTMVVNLVSMTSTLAIMVVSVASSLTIRLDSRRSTMVFRAVSKSSNLVPRISCPDRRIVWQWRSRVQQVCQLYGRSFWPPILIRFGPWGSGGHLSRLLVGPVGSRLGSRLRLLVGPVGFMGDQS